VFNSVLTYCYTNQLLFTTIHNLVILLGEIGSQSVIFVVKYFSLNMELYAKSEFL
jgi:hypothetical protein